MNSQSRPAPEVSCVICTVDRADSIARAVRSVLDCRHASFELVVIDQSADTRTRDACQEFSGDPRFRYVHSTQRGLSRAYNRGILETTAPIIAFTDDDCVAHEDWLAAIGHIFFDEPDVDMLYGQTLIPPCGQLENEVIPALEFPEPRRLERSRPAEIIGMGANFALRRSLVEEIGAFDEALGGGGPLRSAQDYDLQYRVYRAHRVVRLSPEVNVDHYGARTEGTQWDTTMSAYGYGDGAFYAKHIRCGDITALRLASQRLGKLLLRELVNPIRRKPTRWPYIRSFLRGARAGYNFPLNRQERMYILNPEGA